MKQTRTIDISDLVFTSEDLRRIAKVFELAKKSSPERTVNDYVVTFDDKTKLESDTPEVFNDESLTAPARPIAIAMSFHDYSRNRHISLSINHGDSPFGYGSQAVIGATEASWLGENFLALKDALQRTRPQSFWFRRHRTFLLNLIAVGLGSLGLLFIHFLIVGLERVSGSGSSSPPPTGSTWQAISALPTPVLFVLDWLLRWGFGFTLGAAEVRRWLLAMWPTIEFDFGLPHLQIEKSRRIRLRAVAALIIFPIIAAFLYDLLKHVW